MMDKREKQVVLYYLNNLSQKSFYKNKEEAILSWIGEVSEDLFGMDLDSQWDTSGVKRMLRLHKRRAAGDVPDAEEENRLSRDLKTVRGILAKQPIVNITARGYDKGMDTLLDVFKIAPDQQAVLRYMIYREKLRMMEKLNDAIMARYNKQYFRIYAAIAGVSLHTVEKALAFDSALVSKGILDKDDDGEVSLTTSFRRLLHSRHDTEAAIKKAMLGAPASASLTRDNFKYIEDEYEYIRMLLASAVKKHKAGVNILLYGIPGTGKTELSKTLSKEIGVSLYMLSETGENDRDARIGQLATAQTLLADDGNAVILFDEAEDAFHIPSPYASEESSKLYYNRMLEKNKTPVIWVSNSIDAMDSAYIRRFTYALKVKKPDQAARQEIWKNIRAKHKVSWLADSKIAEYAKQYDIAPSFIDTAVGAANLTRSVNAIERTIDSLQKATLGYVPKKKIGHRKKTVEPLPFAAELLNTDTDLPALAERVVQKGSRKFSLCLYGAPGTGKSAFARYLAEKMGLKVIHKRASDLISMWVGGTEKNIARAFHQAREKKALLVFDEADSFLRSRKGAQRSWEVTAVNEMLTWMESHPYPFICTTNLMQDLDEASLRRFTFKVKYDFLKPAQVALAFRHFFGAEAAHDLSHLTHLTPGDFAVVKSKQDILDTADHAELVRMLTLEQDAKGVKSTKIGFV